MLDSATPDQIAVFIQEYVRREHQPDAGVLAVIAADLRDPQWLPHHVAEMILSKPEIQAAISAVRAVYKPPEIKEVSAETITADAETIFEKAKNDRQYTAALAAKKLQAEIAGLLKKDININVRHSVETMTDEQLEAIARRAPIDAEFKEVGGLPVTVSDAAT